MQTGRLVAGHLQQVCAKAPFRDLRLFDQKHGKALQHHVLRVLIVVQERGKIGRKRIGPLQHQRVARGGIARQVLTVQCVI